MEKGIESEEVKTPLETLPPNPASDVLINASGHVQELDRNFRLINICGLGITAGNTWLALGGSIVSE